MGLGSLRHQRYLQIHLNLPFMIRNIQTMKPDSLASGIPQVDACLWSTILKEGRRYVSLVPERPRLAKDANMKPRTPDQPQDMQPEYDFSGGVRGKHHQAYAQGTNIVLLDADVAEVFKDSAAVNEALRLLLRLAKEQAHAPKSA